MQKNSREKIKNTASTVNPNNIINRRNIEPLLIKANQLLKSYEQATECVVSVLDQNGQSIEASNYRSTVFFCSLCRRFCCDPNKRWGKDEYPCTKMHALGIQESLRLGGSYIYLCGIGFVFWTSPVYSGGRYAGSLIAGRVLGINREKAAENIYMLCCGAIPRERIFKYLAGIPEQSCDKIKALAQLLQVCAKKISGGAYEHNETPGCFSGQNAGPENMYLIPSGTAKTIQSGDGNLLEKERMLLASLQRGDNNTGMKILSGILHTHFVNNSGDLELLKLRAIELVVLLSRASINKNKTADCAVFDANNHYFKWIEESKTAEKLTDTLRMIIDRMSGNIFHFYGVRHSSALRKAERFIWINYTHKISLQEIAAASGLSAPYFSTIFKEERGENLSVYLNRLRIEKATAMLTETESTLKEIAESCGFEDQSWFSKIFKIYTGMTPGKYREKGGNSENAPFFIKE
jgi:AraC-like DNA-binding protein/ligand-binding sensor protein